MHAVGIDSVGVYGHPQKRVASMQLLRTHERLVSPEVSVVDPHPVHVVDLRASAMIRISQNAKPPESICNERAAGYHHAASFITAAR